jgi:hypothetical protein
MIETQHKRRGHYFMPPLAVQNKIPALYETENIPTEDKIVHLHYFCASGDWWITELGTGDDENLAFGYVKLAAMPECAEWGYIDMAELEELNVLNGLVIVERDCYWEPKPFKDIAEAH